MSIRIDRVASMLQREIAEILSTEYSDQLQPMVTVTGLRVTNDLSIAYVYVSVLGDNKEQKNAVFGHLRGLSARVRGSLARRIRHQLKGVPEVRFFLDDTLEHVQRIEELFGRIRAEKDDRDEVS